MFDGLEENLGLGAILEDDPDFGDNFNLRGESVWGAARLLGKFS